MATKQILTAPARPAGRTIVLCVDEGVSDPEHGALYRRKESNVVRIHDAILRDAPNQVSIYLSGRSDREIETGAFCPLASASLLAEAFAALTMAVVLGDKIFLVGAGRGAAVCVNLARLLAEQGLPERATVWKNRAGRVTHVQYSECIYKKEGTKSKGRAVAIEQMILLDPLVSLSFPALLSPSGVTGHVLVESAAAPANIGKVLSLLAIDDHREFFEPLILDRAASVTEVWLPGMHEAVVGVGRERAVSDIGLAVATETLLKQGVQLYEPATLEINRNLGGVGVLSCEVQPTSMKRRDRAIRTNQNADGGLPRIHVSAIARAKNSPDYAPKSLLNLGGKFAEWQV